MITIRNINLDELLQLLNGIRSETNSVDMEVNEENKEIVFIPVKSAKPEEDITERIKKMKEQFEKEKNGETKQIGAPPTVNLSDIKKLF